MRLTATAFVVSCAIGLSGCATVQYGDKAIEASLKKLEPVPGKTSLYVCREDAAFFGAGNRATAIVNNNPIGTLKPNNFAHTLLDPGKHDVWVKRNPGGDSGVLSFNGTAGEVVILWVGMTAGGFGTLTVDNFDSKFKAEACVRGADYAVRAE